MKWQANVQLQSLGAFWIMKENEVCQLVVWTTPAPTEHMKCWQGKDWFQCWRCILLSTVYFWRGESNYFWLQMGNVCDARAGSTDVSLRPPLLLGSQACRLVLMGARAWGDDALFVLGWGFGFYPGSGIVPRGSWYKKIKKENVRLSRRTSSFENSGKLGRRSSHTLKTRRTVSSLPMLVAGRSFVKLVLKKIFG